MINGILVKLLLSMTFDCDNRKNMAKSLIFREFGAFLSLVAGSLGIQLTAFAGCRYSNDVFQVGEIFNTLDGCNKCLCTEQGMQCTARPCSNRGFDKGEPGPVLGNCFYNHLWYNETALWRATDDCNTCYCYTVGNFQGSFACTTSLCKSTCPSQTVTGHGFQPTITSGCRYGLNVYQVGEEFTAMDGCNNCLCTEQGMQCTAKPCSKGGFAKGVVGPLYGDCLYRGDNLWYNWTSQWQARDHCNTCFCASIGNYQGAYVCTSSLCRSACSPSVITG